jgi:phage terminase large subunit-like protein
LGADLSPTLPAGDAESPSGTQKATTPAEHRLTSGVTHPSKEEQDRSGPSPGQKPTAPDEKSVQDQSQKAKPKISQLRTAYEDLKRRYQQLEEQYKKAQQVQIESHPEYKSLKERYEQTEKRLRDLDNEIKYLRYESSSEYKERYEKPFIEAYQAGRAKAASLKVVGEDGTERQGKPEDFDTVCRILDDDKAAEVAAQLFGAKAPLVLYYRERVHELNNARIRAAEEFRKNAEEKIRQWEEANKRHRERTLQLWKQYNEEAQKNYPKWFAPVEGDEELNEVLRKGYELVDKAFTSGKDMSPEDMIRLHAAVRNRAAAFGRMVLENKRLQNRIKELEKELAQFKSSEPAGTPGGRAKSATKPPAAGIDEVLNELDKLAIPG